MAINNNTFQNIDTNLSLQDIPIQDASVVLLIPFQANVVPPVTLQEDLNQYISPFNLYRPPNLIGPGFEPDGEPVDRSGNLRDPDDLNQQRTFNRAAAWKFYFVEINGVLDFLTSVSTGNIQKTVLEGVFLGTYDEFPFATVQNNINDQLTNQLQKNVLSKYTDLGSSINNDQQLLDSYESQFNTNVPIINALTLKVQAILDGNNTTDNLDSVITQLGQLIIKNGELGYIINNTKQKIAKYQAIRDGGANQMLFKISDFYRIDAYQILSRPDLFIKLSSGPKGVNDFDVYLYQR